MIRKGIFTLLLFVLLLGPVTASAAPLGDPTTNVIVVHTVNNSGFTENFSYGDALWVCKSSGGGCVNNFDMGVTSGNQVSFTGLQPATYYNIGFCEGYLQNGNSCAGEKIWATYNVYSMFLPGYVVQADHVIKIVSGE